MRYLFIAGLAATVVGFAATADAQPSYNCNVQLNPAERAICDDPGLAALDREMAGKFYAIFDRLGGNDQTNFRREQSEWRRNRDACGRATGCLRANYVYRIGQFDAITGGGAAPLVRQSNVNVLPDGTFERHNLDGSIDRRDPAGNISTEMPDGSILTYQYAQVPGAGIPDLPPPMANWAEQVEANLLGILDNILTDQEYADYLATESGKQDLVLVDWRLRSIDYLTSP
jgi:uncharacterized protein